MGLPGGAPWDILMGHLVLPQAFPTMHACMLDRPCVACGVGWTIYVVDPGKSGGIAPAIQLQYMVWIWQGYIYKETLGLAVSARVT